MNSFSERLRELRQKRGISQRVLSGLCGFSSSMIGLYEAGKAEPTADALIKIADCFGVSTDYLLGRENKIYN